MSLVLIFNLGDTKAALTHRQKQRFVLPRSHLPRPEEPWLLLG